MLAAFLIIALCTHNLEYWAIVKWWSLNLTTVGFLFIFFSLEEMYGKCKVFKILFKPGKWYFNIAGVLLFILTLSLSYMLMDWLAVHMNNKIRSHYLAGKTNGAVATVIGVHTLSFTLKSTYKQPVMVIEYITDKEVIRQGLDPKQFKYLKPGQKVDLLYSREHPSFFKLE